jgi:hypothetical protein
MPGDDVVLDADRLRSLDELAPDRRLEREHPVELRRREERAQEHPVVGRADAVDASMALHEPHRVPRQVEVDDVASLLEVHTLREHVGGDEDVVAVLGPRRRLHRAWSELEHDVLVGLLPGDGGDPTAQQLEAGINLDGLSEPLHDPIERVRVVGEDQRLAPVALVLVADRLALRLRDDLRELVDEQRELHVEMVLDRSAASAKSRSSSLSRSASARSSSIR